MSNPINDQTKPSRIQRRWKASSIADLVRSGLTDCLRGAILTASINRSTGIAVSETNGASRYQCGFFTRKISVLHFMSSWVGSLAAGRSVCPVLQPTQFGTMIAVMLSGLKPFTNGSQS